MRKSWESQKGERAQETQTLRGMPKSQEKVIAKKKSEYTLAKTRKKDKSKKSGKKKKNERHKESNCW
jgi:hypothetical protein